MLNISTDTFPVVSAFIAEEINVKKLPFERIDVSPTMIKLKDNAAAVVYKYGAVVFFNLNDLEVDNYIEELKNYSEFINDNIEKEYLEIQITSTLKEEIDGGVLKLNSLTVEKTQLIADVMAKSVVLDSYEKYAYGVYSKIEQITDRLQNGKVFSKRKDIINLIGETLYIKQRMTGRAEMQSKPDVLWENPELEKLFQLLNHEYEIKERHGILERKLEIIQDTADMNNNLLQNKQSMKVEWYITILIVIEVIITFYELIFRH